MSATEVYDELYLYVTPEKIYIEAIKTDSLLVIDRASYEISTQYGSLGQIPQTASRKRIWGIIGIIRLIAGPYLIIVDQAEKVGTIAGQEIYRIDNVDIIPYSKSTYHMNEKQIQNNNIYLEMLRAVLGTPHFYFSYTYDLSHTMQRLHTTNPDFLRMTMHERGEQRFIWNSFLLQDLISKPEQQKFCFPIIHGFISLNTIIVNGQPINWGIISRRSIHRAGTRLFCRGVDGNGYVANYVETEQILEVRGSKSSFVQTRGSIPLFWQQAPNLKYKPVPKLSVQENHLMAFSRHFDSQIFHYGRQVLVNLIDQTGPEAALESAYRNLAQELGNQNVKYEAFDFHAECRKMQWHRLNILMARLAQDQEQMGYFLLTGDGVLVSIQSGVFRTNCIDCLDRTNVVQSMLARVALSDALSRLQVISKIEEHPSLEYMFKQVWADNADVVSIQYSGTSALKTDFTRTGKRTPLGAIKDGINSLTRYYKNNFADGFRQDGIDLFLGKYKIQDGESLVVSCPLESARDWRYAVLPLILLVASSMLVASVFVPSRYTTEILLYMLFWAAMIAGTFLTIIHYGKQYVDKPKLS